MFIVTSTVLREFAECVLNDLQNPCLTEMAQRSCADQIEIQELRWNVTMRRKHVVKNDTVPARRRRVFVHPCRGSAS